ncbi:hypothetical protein T484DRAFT_1606207, partial [Baffinella frigidus]
TPFDRAVANNNVPSVLLLIRYGADVDFENSEGDRPLLPAVKRGCAEVVQILISHGADAD